ncbi:hypothetical protein IJJ12_03035 [bacterium]|nr:hypothetical protein [bacterium]
MDKHILTVTARDLKTKPAAMRREGQLPLNVFGRGQSQAFAASTKDTAKLLDQISESTVFYLQAGKKELPVMLEEIQRHPVTDQLLHVSARQVDLKQKVTAAIPVETVGTFNVPGAIYQLVQDEIEAEGLPTDLPEKFVIDLSKFTAIGDEVHYADLDFDRSKVTLQVDNEHEPVLVVNELKEEVEPEEKPAETAEATESAAEEAAPAA